MAAPSKYTGKQTVPVKYKDVRLGLLIDFNVPKLVDGVHRVVNKLPES